MTGRRLDRFLDALATGERPREYQADAEEVAIIRAAVTLRAARPAADAPREDFVNDLFERLSTDLATESEPAADEPRAAKGNVTGRPGPVSVTGSRAALGWASLRSRQGALVAAAAAAILVTGSVVATEQLDHPGSKTPVPALSAAAVRTGSFQTTDGQVLGQVVAYRGRPSWIFMNVDVPRYSGRVVCKLQIADGTVVAFGTFDVHQGVGQFSRSLQGVDVSELRGARLFGDSGATVASATFTG
jgi:hypothetical protein